MLVLIEIALTVWAWKRGWEKLALIPVGFVFGLSLLVGLSSGPTGVSDPSVLGFLLILELLSIVALVLMGVRGYHPQTGLEAKEEAEREADVDLNAQEIQKGEMGQA